jgi:flagellar hook-length control protein FliK
MNVSLANLMTPLSTPAPTPSVSAPTDRRDPQRPADNRVADKGSENPKSSSPRSAAGNDRVRPVDSKKAPRDKSDVNRRPDAKKALRNEKGDKKVAVADAGRVSTGIEHQINLNLEAKPASAEAMFATILQAAKQTKKPVLPGAVKSKAVVSKAPNPVTAGKPVVKEQGPVAVRADVGSATLKDLSSPAIAAPANQGLFKKALASAVPAKARPGKVVAGEKTAPQAAPQVAPTAKSMAPSPGTVVTPEIAASIANQTRKPVQPDVAKGAEVLKDSAIPAMQQGAVSASENVGRPVQPVRGPASRQKAILKGKSSAKAKITASASQEIMHKRMEALLNGGGRQARFDIKGAGESGRQQDGVVAAQTAPVSPTAELAGETEASAPPSPVNQISDAFQASAARKGQEIVIRLDPPELGRVSVKLRIQGGEVRGVLEVDNPRTLSQLQREAPNLLTRLTDAGVEMKRMELSLSDDGSSRESTRDQGWFAQQYGENGSGFGSWGSQGQSGRANDALSAGADIEGELSPATATIGDDSINVWI